MGREREAWGGEGAQRRREAWACTGACRPGGRPRRSSSCRDTRMLSDGGKEAPRPQSEVSSCGIDKEQVGWGGPGQGRASPGGGERASSSSPHRRVVVEADVRASPVSWSLHQFALLRAVRWAWVGSQGGGSGGTEGARGAGGDWGLAGAGYSASPSAAAGQPHTGCTAASRPRRRGDWCWSVSARGTAWRRHRKAGR